MSIEALNNRTRLKSKFVIWKANFRELSKVCSKKDKKRKTWEKVKMQL